jgi:dipeptidyl aminopeptidase/acylaminoacyl peptidase
MAPAAEPTPVATPSPISAVGPDEPWIVFQQFRSTSTVTLVRPDGSGLHSPTLEVPGADQTNPDWSPDGSQLVLAVAAGGHEDLWIVDADGSDARILSACEGDCLYLDDPDWSPDGRSVLFSRMRVADDGTVIGTLEQVDVASGATSVIVRAEPAHFYAGQRWSPDGASIVLEVVRLTGISADSDVEDVSLAIIDLAAPTPAGRALLGAGRFPETAAWAPDGSVIVFGALAAPGGGATDLFAIRPDGTGLRQVTRLVSEGGSATHPEVTADSASVVFAATLPGEDGPVLGQIDLAGGEVTPATGDAFISGVHPRLRPLPASPAPK